MKKELKLTELNKSELKSVNGGYMTCVCNVAYDPEKHVYYIENQDNNQDVFYPPVEY